MKNLWTSWHMVHATGEVQLISGGLFDLPGDSPYDKDLPLLYWDGPAIVLLNRFPRNNGHLLVSPRRHLPCLIDLELNEWTVLMLMSWRAAAILKVRLALHETQYRVQYRARSPVMATADHLPFHLAHRWGGDLSFIVVVSEVRTIPGHIGLTFDSPLPAFFFLFFFFSLSLTQERQEPA